MNYRFLRLLERGCVVLILLAGAPVSAAPGAHGPNGEHLDAPGQLSGGTDAVPRFEAQSEYFELVGRLQGGEFSMLINRFATNEPVLNARVEVESGALRASATFHADKGDYAVDEPALLKALAAPGEHPLVITVLAGTDSDLLDGILRVTGAVPDGHVQHDHDLPGTVWIVLALMAVAAFSFFLGRRRGHEGSTAIGGAR